MPRSRELDLGPVMEAELLELLERTEALERNMQRLLTWERALVVLVAGNAGGHLLQLL